MKRAKALTNFYSAEFGSVSVGDEMQIASSQTYNDLMNAGYIEEIGTVHDGSVAPEQTTASKSAKARKSAKADVEFATESGVNAQSMSEAQAQANANADAMANASTPQNAQFNTEFSQELGSANAQS